jgi:hypothetical protein
MALFLSLCLRVLALWGVRPHDAGAAAQGDVTLRQSGESVECYDFLEVTVSVPRPPANPFTEATVTGVFGLVGSDDATAVSGFCDSADGSVFRIRFMPAKPGDYAYQVAYEQGDFRRSSAGTFRAVDAGRRGILRVDARYPWHFTWEGTGEHYFLNGTTAFLLFGWDDPKVIEGCIDRMARFKVNRLRALLCGRSDHTWTEPIKPGNGFRMWLNPWVAERPDDVTAPGFDYTRFDVTYWQKVERAVHYARDKDLAVSLIMDWNDTPVHAAAGSEDEHRYYRYAVARLAAFSNVCWDLGDDLDSFRDEQWTHETGMMLMGLDPYKHLATSHPVNNEHQDRTSPWFAHTSFQEWSRPQHGWMLDQRRRQADTGRIIPQVNEEYGYEDHYPTWAPYQPPAADADGDRRAAWEIAMAGCYQTTGETAKRGTGVPPDAGGGWVNGRGDDAMVLLKLQAHMVEFFTSFEWWKAEPHDELVDSGAFCLAEPGRLYAVYLPHGGAVTVTLEAGRYEVSWFNARTGVFSDTPAAEGPKWTSPAAADDGDWALLLRKVEARP